MGLLRQGKFILKNWSISFKIAFASTLVLIAAVLTTSLFGYVHHGKMFTEYNQHTVRGIASAVASNIRPDEYRRIVETEEKSPYWHELKKQFDIVKKQTNVKYLYALDNNVDGKIRFMVEGQLPDENPALICQLGDVLEIGSFTPQLFEALATGQTTVGEEHDIPPFGVMVSGYAPILDETGQIIGVVGADIGVELIRRNMNQFALLQALFTLGVAIFFSYILFLYIRRTVNKPIDEVIEATGRLLQDDFSGNELLSKNKVATVEIKRLINSFRQIRKRVIKPDTLTDAYSRAAGLKTLEMMMEESAVAGVENCAAFIDLDGLKTINDVHGHLAGDAAIKTVVDTLIEGTRSNDMVCRYGGDEFLVLFRHCDLKAAEAAVNRMKERLRAINHTQKRPYSIDFSYGLAEIRFVPNHSVEDFIHELDSLMYENKQKAKKL